VVRWIRKDVEGSGCGLFRSTVPTLAWRDWGKPLKSQDCQCSDRDSNHVPSEHKLEASPIAPSVSAWLIQINFFYLIKIMFPFFQDRKEKQMKCFFPSPCTFILSRYIQNNSYKINGTNADIFFPYLQKRSVIFKWYFCLLSQLIILLIAISFCNIIHTQLNLFYPQVSSMQIPVLKNDSWLEALVTNYRSIRKHYYFVGFMEGLFGTVITSGAPPCYFCCGAARLMGMHVSAGRLDPVENCRHLLTSSALT
jgi:hypothetical protein